MALPDLAVPIQQLPVFLSALEPSHSACAGAAFPLMEYTEMSLNSPNLSVLLNNVF